MERPVAAEEVRQLRGCLNDLVSVMALPALWAGGEPPQIVGALLDALLEMLDLAFAFVRLNDPDGGPAIELMRVAEPPRAAVFGGDVDLSLVSARLGLQGEIGIVVAGTKRLDFPRQTEKLLLDVAANQAAVALQQARLLSEQRRVARELDERVARRTTELAAATEELRRNQAVLAEGQRLSVTGSFSLCVDPEEIAFSEELYRIFAFEPGTPVPLERIANRVHPEDRHLLIDKVGTGGSAGGDHDYEMRLLMPDGSVKYLHTICHDTRDPSGRQEFIGVLQDVTQRRVAEDALSKARSELAHVARAMSLGVLTAAIAHEINQPLSGIVTNASTCLRMLAADPPDVDGARETARRTIRDGNRASDVIVRLRLLFSKKEFTLESLDLNEATREVIALSSSDLQRNRVVLQSELADDLPAVTGDRVQLQQVILNLLRNASDAMADVDDRPRRLLVRTDREGERVRVTVRDAGVGVDHQSIDKLFDAFYTTKSSGMGIGLSISRSIVERHQGRLWAELNDGPGATFSFSIPHRPVSVMDAAPVMRTS